MTENEFWQFLKGLLAQGRVAQVSGRIDSDDPQIHTTGEYIGGHSLLPKDYDKISKEKIIEMSELLIERKAKLKTKEAILMILAHHSSKEALTALERYIKNPDKGLEIFAELALDECKMWSDG